MKLLLAAIGRYRIGEAVVIVGVALAFFATLLVFLRSIFPAGPILGEVAMREGAIPRPQWWNARLTICG
jgi:hypothetical protein